MLYLYIYIYIRAIQKQPREAQFGISHVEKDGENVDDDEFCNEFIIIKKAGSEQRHFQVVVIIHHSFMLIAPFICNLSVCLCILQCPWLLYYISFISVF
jgi:hypothetical protein